VCLTGCDSVEDVSDVSDIKTNFIDTEICTTEDTFLWRWNEQGADFFEYREFELHVPRLVNNETESFEQHLNKTNTTSIMPEFVENIKKIQKGSIIKIENVYIYSKIFCCEGLIVMATINGNKYNSKLVDVSSIFKHSSIKEPKLILRDKFVRSCQD